MLFRYTELPLLQFAPAYALQFVPNDRETFEIFYGSTIVPFKDDFPKDTQLYRIMTTKPEETVQN